MQFRKFVSNLLSEKADLQQKESQSVWVPVPLCR